jgi:hypothetical protein
MKPTAKPIKKDKKHTVTKLEKKTSLEAQKPLMSLRN